MYKIAAAVIGAVSMIGTAMAAPIVLSNNNSIAVLKFVDEFTNETTSCQVVLGTLSKSKPRISIFAGSNNSPKKTNDLISGKAGNFDGTGLMFKIDEGTVYQMGSIVAGGDLFYSPLPKGILAEVAGGKKIVIRVYPDNQYATTLTAEYSLEGSAEAVKLYKACLAGDV